MKFRLASPHLAERLHAPLRFGRRWRGHELALRMVQLVLLIGLAALGARLVAGAVGLAARAIGGFGA